MLFVLIAIFLSFSMISSVNATINTTDNDTVSQNTVIKNSKIVYNHLDKHNHVPKTVMVMDKNVSSRSFFYLMSKTVVYKYNKNNSDFEIKVGIKSSKNVKGDSIKGKYQTKSYYKIAKYVLNYVDKYNKVPSYYKSQSKKKIKYETLFFMFSKILAITKYNHLPKTVYINLDKQDAINNNGKTLKLYNNYKKTDLSKYLKSTSWTPSKSTYIKNLAKKITKGKKTKYEKAEAIFNWTITNIKYSYYYNTRYGGGKTIKIGKGNCVDMSHAYAALSRSVGLPTRYIHSRSDFRKSGWLGHIWLQVLVNNKWIPVDISGENNRFGGVVNWNQNTYHRISVYSETPW
ncbi:transglutaminase-like superfamily protein [Methanobrevibacter cuticularis]|uniref:Transglutaminase-like superfamily protein n=1 Tax=Methanobrevibacter cuticularis TaxID=47311 RepID=A0A166CZZ2_9EURY|nr:transglutaminase-like domain-containing protein [Methanobrevibacter cuticularis]KZX15054.1 transglutaminase-like superfamily protein [Methanobrevibacter cuticularis]